MLKFIEDRISRNWMGKTSVPQNGEQELCESSFEYLDNFKNEPIEEFVVITTHQVKPVEFEPTLNGFEKESSDDTNEIQKNLDQSNETPKIFSNKDFLQALLEAEPNKARKMLDEVNETGTYRGNFKESKKVTEKANKFEHNHSFRDTVKSHIKSGFVRKK